MIVTQSCDSLKCKKKYKDQITKFCEAITTVHEFDLVKRELRCTICGKITKLQKK